MGLTRRLMMLAAGAALTTASATTAALAQTAGTGPVRNVVLVHGALLDGSSWRNVHHILSAESYHVSIVQLPLTGFDDDLVATRRVLDQQDGPVVLVGQSYGGAVSTVAGTDPKVTALVYVAALQPDAGESVADLNGMFPAVPANADLRPADEGYVVFDRSRFADHVSADLPKAESEFLAASQTPSAVSAFTAKVPAAAWRDKPSYAVVATDDKSVRPELQRFMSERAGARVVEVKASQLVQFF
jgi:pimeloyl-ACP methyl ester carboxylesterase